MSSLIWTEGEIRMVARIGLFLSYLMRPNSVKIGLFLGAITILSGIINALFSVNFLKLFTGEIFSAAEVLRLSYAFTLIFAGYVILLLVLLHALVTLLRNDNFKANAKKLQVQLIILISFIIAFFIARAFVVLLDIPLNPAFQLSFKGYRIHHFFYGISLLIIGGWLGHTNYGNRIMDISAVLYGGGLGLVTDEFGLLLTFGDYWSSQSYVFFLIFSLVLLLLLLLETYKLVNAKSISIEALQPPLRTDRGT